MLAIPFLFLAGVFVIALVGIIGICMEMREDYASLKRPRSKESLVMLRMSIVCGYGKLMMLASVLWGTAWLLSWLFTNLK